MKLWAAATGEEEDPELWPGIALTLSRLDALVEDQSLEEARRAVIAETLNSLRQCEHASRNQGAPYLRGLANIILSMLQDSCAFAPAQLAESKYIVILRAAARAWDSGPQTLGQSRYVSDVRKYARLDLEIVKIGLGRMADENLAEYVFDSDRMNDEEFRIVDEDELAARIEELEEAKMLEMKVTVKHAEPLRSDYRELIQGLAMKHDLSAAGAPTGGEIIVQLSDQSGDVEVFRANCVGFATDLELALSKTSPTFVSQSIAFHGPIVNSPIQAASPAAKQYVRMTLDVDMNMVRQYFDQAKTALAKAKLDEDTREIVDASLVTVERHLAKGKPNPKLLLPMVTTIATALTSAGAVGQGLDYMHKLIELLAGLAS